MSSTNPYAMIDSLMEESVYLCEVRGELDDVDNQKIEDRLDEIRLELQCLRWQIDQEIYNEAY